MSISFYDASVGSYLQILESTAGVLETGKTHAADAGLDRVTVGVESLDQETFGQINGLGHSIDTVLEMAGYKQTGHCRKLVVTGCMAERYGPELADALGDDADAVVGFGVPVTIGTKPTLAVFFVVGVVTGEPDHLGVAFECQDVSRDAIEEPAIMRDNDGRTRELE